MINLVINRVSLSLIFTVCLSIQLLAQKQNALGTFTKAEVKADSYYATKEPVSPASKFVYAYADMKGYIKVNGKIITLNHQGGEDSDTSTSSLLSTDDFKYSLYVEYKWKKEERLNPNKKLEERYEIKVGDDVLFTGKLFRLLTDEEKKEAQKEQEKSNAIIDRNILDQVLQGITIGLREIPKTKGAYDGFNSDYKILRGGLSPSSIIDEPEFITFQSYIFKAKPADALKAQNEFLQLKKELAPYGDTLVHKFKNQTTTTFFYNSGLNAIEVELQRENISATEVTLVFRISYDKKSQFTGKQLIRPVILDSLMKKVNNAADVVKEKTKTENGEDFYSVKKPYDLLLPTGVSFVTVNKTKVGFCGNPKTNSRLGVYRFVYEIKKYMFEKYKVSPVLKRGMSTTVPHELVFSKFLKEAPGVQLSVKYYSDGAGGGVFFKLSNTLTQPEYAKLTAIGTTAATPVSNTMPEKKPPMLIAMRTNGLYGFIDINNGSKMVIPAAYRWANEFSEGLAAVSKDGEKWGFIDEAGNEVIPFKYISATSFKNGKAMVEEGDLLESRKYYIDKKGRAL